MGKSRRWTLYCVPGDIRDGRIRRRILGRIDALDGAVRGPEGQRWSAYCSSMTSWVCGDCSLMSFSIRDGGRASNQVFLSLRSSDKPVDRRRSSPRKRQQLPSPGHLTEFYKFHLRPSPDCTGHTETFHQLLKKEKFEINIQNQKSQCEKVPRESEIIRQGPALSPHILASNLPSGRVADNQRQPH